MMRVGNLVRFKKTGIVGTIISLKRVSFYAVVEVLHNAPGIPNPTSFTLSNLKKTAEVINESR